MAQVPTQPRLALDYGAARVGEVRALEVHPSALTHLHDPADGVDVDGKGRDLHDRYYSYPWHVLALFDALAELGFVVPPGALILEPFAGRSLALARGLEALGYEVSTADIDAGAEVDWAGCAWERDWSELAKRAAGAVSNTPYRINVRGEKMVAADAVRLMMSWGVPFVACILRSSFSEACDGREGLVTGMGEPILELELGRVAFEHGGGSGDQATSSWFVWERPGPMRWRPWIKRSLARGERERYELAWKKLEKAA